MLFTDFQYLLKKLNPRLYIDVKHQVAKPGFKDYPTAGLYLREAKGIMQYLFGIPHNHVPEYSVSALNFNEIIEEQGRETLNEMIDTGHAPNDEVFLWRGWRAIVSNLIKMRMVDHKRAEKIFRTHFVTAIPQLPRTFIDRKPQWG